MWHVDFASARCTRVQSSPCIVEPRDPKPCSSNRGTHVSSWRRARWHWPIARSFFRQSPVGRRAVLVVGGHDGEDSVFTLLDVLYLSSLAKLEIHALQNFVPPSDQL